MGFALSLSSEIVRAVFSFLLLFFVHFHIQCACAVQHTTTAAHFVTFNEVRCFLSFAPHRSIACQHYMLWMLLYIRILVFRGYFVRRKCVVVVGRCYCFLLLLLLFGNCATVSISWKEAFCKAFKWYAWSLFMFHRFISTLHRCSFIRLLLLFVYLSKAVENACQSAYSFTIHWYRQFPYYVYHIPWVCVCFFRSHVHSSMLLHNEQNANNKFTRKYTWKRVDAEKDSSCTLQEKKTHR